MTRLLVLLAVVIQSALPALVADDLVILLPNGQVQGTQYVTDNNRIFYGFQGIPYATPPIGSLRFEAPQPPQSWVRVWDATHDRNSCLSTSNYRYKDIENEDCLYINVYTPLLKPGEKSLPVMVSIYGGGFVAGTSRKSKHGPDFFMDEDVMVVTFNYRLGAFGFLSTGDSAIVGNAGLKDQALAIKWAHDNVEYFGGDPDKITIFGESAGGASTGLQLVSKKVAGLYRAAIVESGSALTNWSIDPNPKAYADLLATSLGGEIYLNNTQELKQFLQEKSAEEILTATNLLAPRHGEALLDIDIDPAPIKQAWPVIEVENKDAFLTESPYELLDSGRFNQVPIIIGICANEALFFLKDMETTKGLASEFDTFPNRIIPNNLRQNSSDNNVIIKKIKSSYLKEGETFSDNLVALSSYHSDHMFTRGVIKHAELTSKYVPVYLYQFAYYGRPIISFIIPGAEKVGHAAELPFLLKRTVSEVNISDDSADMLTQNRMVKLWTNFAKFLNPTPEQTELIDVVWPSMNQTELNFLNINTTLEVRSPIRGASYEEWKNIFETYGKKPFITF